MSRQRDLRNAAVVDVSQDVSNVLGSFLDQNIAGHQPAKKAVTGKQNPARRETGD